MVPDPISRTLARRSAISAKWPWHAEARSARRRPWHAEMSSARTRPWHAVARSARRRPWHAEAPSARRWQFDAFTVRRDVHGPPPLGGDARGEGVERGRLAVHQIRHARCAREAGEPAQNLVGVGVRRHRIEPLDAGGGGGGASEQLAPG